MIDARSIAKEISDANKRFIEKVDRDIELFGDKPLTKAEIDKIHGVPEKSSIDLSSFKKSKRNIVSPVDKYIDDNGNQILPSFDSAKSYLEILDLAKELYPSEDDKGKFYRNERWNQNKTPKFYEDFGKPINELLAKQFSNKTIDYACKMPFKGKLEKNLILAGKSQRHKTTKALSYYLNYKDRYNLSVLIIDWEDIQEPSFWRDLERNENSPMRYELRAYYDLVIIDDLFNSPFPSGVYGERCKRDLKTFIRHHHDRDTTKFLITMNDPQPVSKIINELGESVEARIIANGTSADIYIYTEDKINKYKFTDNVSDINKDPF